MNLFSYSDKGTAMIVDGICYHKIGSVNRPPAADPIASVQNIEEITFDQDDSGVMSGTAHRVWTPCEVAVSKLPSNSGTQVNISSTGFTAPADGVIRIWTGNGFAQFAIIFKNTVNVGIEGCGGTFIASTPVRVSAGDVIKVSVDYGYMQRGNNFNFLPYIYTGV